MTNYLFSHLRLIMIYLYEVVGFERLQLGTNQD